MSSIAGCKTRKQGLNEVYLFVTDLIFLPKIVIPDTKNNENFDPQTCKDLRLIPDPMKTLLIPIPIPRVVIPDPRAAIPDPGPFQALDP